MRRPASGRNGEVRRAGSALLQKGIGGPFVIMPGVVLGKLPGVVEAPAPGNLTHGRRGRIQGLQFRATRLSRLAL